MNLLECRNIKGLVLSAVALLFLTNAHQAIPENSEEVPMEAQLATGVLTPMEAELATGEMMPMETMNAAGELAAPLEAMLAAGAGVPDEALLAAGVDVMAGMAEAMEGVPVPGIEGAGVNLMEEEREEFIREKMQEPNNGANRGRAPSGGS